MTEQHFPIGLWTDLLTAEDKRRMGNAVWYFLWLLNKVTDQVAGPDGKQRGRVLGGTTLPARAIAPEWDDSLATVRKNLAVLQDGGYIHYRQNGRGYQIEVLYAKWRGRRFSVPDPSPPSASDKGTVQPAESSRVEHLAHSELTTSCNQSDGVYELSPSTALKDARSECTDLRDQSLQVSASLPSKDIAVNIAVDNAEANASTRKEEGDRVWSETDWSDVKHARPTLHGVAEGLRDLGQIRPDTLAAVLKCTMRATNEAWTLHPATEADRLRLVRSRALLQQEIRRATGRPITLTLDPESSARGP